MSARVRNPVEEEAPPLTEGAANAPLHRARMRDLQGMTGTVGGLVLRVSQLLSAAVALSVMATTSDFPSVTAFCWRWYITFASACASAGITVLISNDLGACVKNHCAEFETAIAVAFLGWFGALPSFLLNFWSLALK